MTSQARSVAPRFARDLISLASERSSDKRVELLRRLTDSYLHVEVPVHAAAEYLFEKLVVELVDVISASDRVRVSGYFATRDQLPAVLTHRLATDEDIAVAAPILEDYAALPEPTLIAVAASGSQEHLRSIAGRPVLTSPVTDVVLQRGDQGTVRKLTANQGAQFSSAGMRTLAKKSERDDVLQSLLVDRPDLTLEAIGLLLPIITPELTERLHNRNITIDAVVLGAHLATWMKQHINNIARTDALIEAIRAGHLDLGDVVTDEIGKKHFFGTIAILAAMIGMESDFGFELIVGGSTEQALLLLRSVDMPWPAVKGFLDLKREKTGRGTASVCFDDYNAIDTAAAQRVIRFLNLRRRIGVSEPGRGNDVSKSDFAAASARNTDAPRLPK